MNSYEQPEQKNKHTEHLICVKICQFNVCRVAGVCVFHGSIAAAAACTAHDVRANWRTPPTFHCLCYYMYVFNHPSCFLLHLISSISADLQSRMNEQILGGLRLLRIVGCLGNEHQLIVLMPLLHTQIVLPRTQSNIQSRKIEILRCSCVFGTHWHSVDCCFCCCEAFTLLRLQTLACI